MKNRVKEFREVMGLTQDEFARECPMSRSYLSQIENGRRNISVITMKKIASLLNRKIEEIFFVHYSEQIHSYYGASEQEVISFGKVGQAGNIYQRNFDLMTSSLLCQESNNNREVKS